MILFDVSSRIVTYMRSHTEISIKELVICLRRVCVFFYPDKAEVVSKGDSVKRDGKSLR